VLQDVTLEIRPGEVVAVVGESGAGKSSLANLIPRLYDVTRGTVRVDGHDVRDLTLSSLRDSIGIVPQETILFSGTVRDNIAYGRPDATDAEIEAAARAAHAHDFIASFPDGYSTVVGERGRTLSGGQCQRLALARALLRNPKILILDEATSSLDAESEAQVQAALETLMHQRTTLVIAHRLSTVQNADRILVLDHGHVVEEGRHEDLLRRGGTYSRLYALQSGETRDEG
jgi:subfamily B ATP-binding cassette protein MsbA